MQAGNFLRLINFPMVMYINVYILICINGVYSYICTCMFTNIHILKLSPSSPQCFFITSLNFLKKQNITGFPV